MSDTQWPRFEVFQQVREGQPHRNVGSVHAPDAEMALQNARDVFVRRPACLSLWVVPAGAIYARTDQELTAEPRRREEDGIDESATETYYVFQKLNQRRSMTYVTHTGEVQAATPVQALARAVDEYGDKKTFVWWVCPEKAVHRSSEDDVDSMFAPAQGKTYRMPAEYRVLTEMLALRTGESEFEGDT